MQERFLEANLDELKRLEPIIRKPGTFNYLEIPRAFGIALGAKERQITGDGKMGWFYKTLPYQLDWFSRADEALHFINKYLCYQLNSMHGHPYTFMYHAEIRSTSMDGPIFQFGTHPWGPHDHPARAVMACAISALIYEIELERFGETIAAENLKLRRKEDSDRYEAYMEEGKREGWT